MRYGNYVLLFLVLWGYIQYGLYYAINGVLWAYSQFFGLFL